MAMGIADFTAQLADLQAQFKAGTITQEQLAEGLRDLWTASENYPALFDQMGEVIAIKAEILTALQAALNVKGTVANVSALPADAEDGEAYQLVNINDPADGDLFRRVAGAWVNVGPLRGAKGRSAFDIAVAVAEAAEEEPPADEAAFIAQIKQPALDAAALATSAAENADAKAELAEGGATLANTKALFAQEQGDYAKDQGDYAKDQGDIALAAASAANEARDRAIFKVVYESRAELYADLDHEPKTFALVSDDATPDYNGTYVKSGASGAGSWVKQDSTGGLTYQPLSAESGYIFALVDAVGRPAFMITTDGSMKISKVLAGSITRAALAVGAIGADQVENAAITYAKLDPSTVQPLMAQAMNPDETGLLYAIADVVGRYALAVDKSGAVLIPKLSLGAGSIAYSALGADITPYVGAYMSPETGYLWAILDSAGRIGLGIQTDGTVVGKFANALTNGSVTTIKIAAQAVTSDKIADQAVTEAKLEKSLARLAVPHQQDVVEVFPDDHRANFAEVGSRTAADGSFWERLPPALTANVRGVNQSGTGLSFRRSAGLPFRGKRYAGTFDPGALASSRLRGELLAGSTYPPAPSSPLAGDYFVFKGTAPAVLGGVTFAAGDLSVYDGSTWARQAAPAALGGAAYQPGDWWSLSAGGTFDGVTYSAGDRIVYLGLQFGGGSTIPRWLKPDPAKGELFYRGEFDPAGGLPASPVDGDCYQASAAGTAGGFTFAIGDYLVREGGVWGQVATDTIRAVAAGVWICLPCSRSAAEWEVRRSDKSGVRVGALLKARRQSAPRRGRFDAVLYSDSMFRVSSTGDKIVAKLGRTGEVYAFPGATSRDVLAMIEYEIAVLGDRYRGAVHLMWHGQNNLPVTSQDANSAMLREASLRMASLVGARDSRLLFFSVMGSRDMTWNGSRLVCAQLETAFAGSGVHVELEQWYQRTFPGQCVITRQMMLAAAVGRTTPDPQFPGMTEAQVAATYGIIPYSFYGAGDALPFPADQLNYVGTWNTTGLPTGGATKDYYIRTGGGGAGEKVGNLVVNVAGVWTEVAQDTVHLSPTGAEAFSDAATAIVNALYY